jgi:hypothetical protein
VEEKKWVAGAVFFDAKAASPQKSDGGGAPSLPWGNEGRFRAGVRQHLS